MVGCNCSKGPKAAQDVDVNEIKSMMSAYRAAWMAADSAAIMESLTEDFVLFMPGKSGKPIVGKGAVREFWFPTSDIKYPIVSYEVTHEEVDGSGDMAYYQGVSRLTWCTVEDGIARDTTTSVSEFTNVLARDGGRWKLRRIMYNLKDPDYHRQ